MKKIRGYYVVLLFVILVLGLSIPKDSLTQALSPTAEESKRATKLKTMTDINGTETTETFDNPERGFYRTQGIHFKASENQALNLSHNITHLRLDLSEFSGAYNGAEDIELSADALNCLDETLKQVEQNGKTVIIRFAYDENFSGGTTYEPSMEMILHHQEQLGAVISKYHNAVLCVELGLFGKWGELHSSAVYKNEKDNPALTNAMNQAMDQWLNVLSDDIYVSFRTPGQYADWYGIERNTLSQNVTTPTETAYRVGIYNDGYLGSDDDLGTYANRENEISWLKNQAAHTPFGGELVANDNNGTVKNTAAYLATEAFNTHTTYLNYEWNQNALFAMKEEAYPVEDEQHKDGNGFQYLENYLGYRFVIRSGEMTSSVFQNQFLQIKLTIENVGFANLLKKKKVSVILKNADKQYEIVTNINPCTWQSGKVTDVSVSLELPKKIEVGEYQCYLKIARAENASLEYKNHAVVRLANEGIWNQELQANALGSVKVEEAVEESHGDSGEQGADGNSKNESGQPIGNNSENENGQPIGNNSENESDQPIGNNSGNESGQSKSSNSKNESGQPIGSESKNVRKESSSEKDVLNPKINNTSDVAKREPNLNTKLTPVLNNSIQYKQLKYRICKVVDGSHANVSFIKSTVKKKHIIIPDSFVLNGITYTVTGIEPNAMKSNKNVRKLVIGKKVVHIGKKAFYGCRKLKSVTIKTKKLKTKTVGKGALKKLGKGVKFRVPKGMKKRYGKLLGER